MIGKRKLIPPITKEGTLVDIGTPKFLAPGVLGYAIKMADGRVFIPDIRAFKPGSGAVGRFLDRLAPCCCVVNVVSGKLRGMLARRGFVQSFEAVDLWQRPINA